MTRKSIRLLLTFIFILMPFSALIPSGNVRALTGPFDGGVLPSLDEFVGQVSNGQARVLRGIYIPGLLAAPVVQQPDGMDDFVSPWQNIVTQFGLASSFGSTGLLAHNYLAGEAFGLLQVGQKIQLVDGRGTVSTYIVKEILHFQAIESGSTVTRFLDLESRTLSTSADLFSKVYSRPGQVVFQTCIQAGSDPSWGRLFVIATPSN